MCQRLCTLARRIGYSPNVITCVDDTVEQG
jgi:hypothetical protein